MGFKEHYDEFARLYEKGYSSVEIAKMFGCSKRTVLLGLRAKGVKRRRGKLKEHEQEICRLYQEGKTLMEIAEIFNCSFGSVARVLERNGVKRRSFMETSREYDINDAYFDKLDSDARLYILGFIVADGYVARNDTIRFNIHKRDVEILEFIRSEICPGAPIHRYRSDQVTLAIYSKKLASRLNQLGITQAKSLTVKYPNEIPNEFHYAFIRGLFDGDGSVYIDKRGNIEFTLAGTYDILTTVQDILVETLGLSRTKLRKLGNIYVLRYKGNRTARLLYDYLYTNASFSLARKRERFEQCIGSLAA